MHSSRMRTARTLTIVWGGGVPTEGGVPAQGVPWGVPVQGGVPSQGVCLPMGAAWGRGGYLSRGCHVTYPIMHLMLPVCCLHTN